MVVWGVCNALLLGCSSIRNDAFVLLMIFTYMACSRVESTGMANKNTVKIISHKREGTALQGSSCMKCVSV